MKNTLLRSIKIVALLLILILSPLKVLADLIAKMSPGVFDDNVRTHLIIIGHGEDEGILFQWAGISLAKKIIDQNPRDQILFLTPRYDSWGDNTVTLKRSGFHTVEDSPEYFTTRRVAEQAFRMQKIAGFHVFGHNSPFYGTSLSGGRLWPDSQAFAHLKFRMTEDAIGGVYGCNSGYEIAPTFSELLGIPMYGSLTGTDFEMLHESQEFLKYHTPTAPVGKWAAEHRTGYKQIERCSQRGCFRMKPENTIFRHGNGLYEANLSFYKLFCKNIDSKICERLMWKGITIYNTATRVDIHSTEDQFQQALFDFMCPHSYGSSLRMECIAALAKADRRTYKPAKTPQWQCDFNGCQYIYAPHPRTGLYSFYKKTDSETTFVDEYELYMKSFQNRWTSDRPLKPAN